MVRAHPRQQVGVPRVARQPLRHLPQQRVAGRPAEAVVDVLEPLQIDQEQGKLVPAAGGAAHVLRHPLEKQAAVRESGEHIVVGEVVEPLLLVDVIDRERDVAGQLRQQLHLFFIEEFGLAGVQREHAYRFIRDNQRQNGHRADSGLGVFLAEQHLGVALRIVGHDGLFLPDRPRDHGASGASSRR